MPDPLDVREVVFSNLLLLGFDVEANEAQSRIPFNRDIFSLPNRKGMEVVMHFLFICLSKDTAKQAFKTCWPICDKRNEQEFRKIISEWLTRIKRENPDSHLPNIAPSLLLSPTGDKFYTFLFYFSTYVLKEKAQSLKSQYGSTPAQPLLANATRKYLQQIHKSLKIQTMIQHNSLIGFIENGEQLQEIWVEYFRELSRGNRKLHKKKREFEKQMRQTTSEMERIFATSSISNKERLNRTRNLQKVNEMWKTVSTLFEAQKLLQNEVERVLHGTTNQHSLEGQQINFKLPDILVRECEKQLNTGKKFRNVFEEGKVNLNSLVDLWNLSLHLIKENLAQFPLPNLESDELYMRAETHNHTNFLNRSITLRNTMSKELLPDLKLSIDELKENIETPTLKSPFSVFKTNVTRLELLPETPPVDFDGPTVHDRRSDIKTTYKKQKEQVSTPDAVNELLERLKLDSSCRTEDLTPVRNRSLKPKQIQTSKNILSSSLKASKNNSSLLPKHLQSTIKTKASNPAVGKKKKANDVLKNSIQNNVNQNSGENKSKSRIPLPNKPQQHENHVSTKESYQKPPTTSNAKALVRPDVKPPSRGKRKSPVNKRKVKSPLNKTNDSFNISKAQELLIDQIAQSVLNSESVCSSNSTEDDTDSSKIHALDNPVEAFSTEAFVSRDKVPRTPASNEKENPFTSYVASKRIENTDTQANTVTLESIQQRYQSIQRNAGDGGERSTANYKSQEVQADLVTDLFNASTTAYPKSSDESFKEAFMATPQSTNKTLFGFTTPGNGFNENLQTFITPLRFGEDDDPITPVNSLLADFDSLRITPSDKSRTAHVNNISLTPTEDADKTPLSSDIIVNRLHDSKIQYNKVLTHNHFDTTPSCVGSSSSLTGTNLNINELINFTPLNSNNSSETNLQASQSTKQNDILNYTKTELKQTTKLFFDNNQAMFNNLKTPNHSVNYTSNMDTTPHQNNTEIINFITPFKDPFSPLEETPSYQTSQNIKLRHQTSLMRTNPLNFSIDEMNASQNITCDDVDSFIEEVLNKTGGKTPGMKSERLFSAHTPRFDLNDYSLMTPGNERRNKNFDFNDDDEI